MLGVTVAAQAADVAWQETAIDGFWTNSANWGGSVPTSSDFALFNTSGNGNTTIDLGASAPTVWGLKFGQATAPSYTIGAGGAGAQDLNVTKDKLFDVYATVTNSQTINANLHLDSGTSSGAYTFNNYSTNANLILNGNLYFNRTSGTHTDYLRIQRDGTTEITGTITNQAAGGDGQVDVVVDTANLILSGGGNWDGHLRVKNSGNITVTETGTIADGNLDIQSGSVTLNSDQTVPNFLYFGSETAGGDSDLVIAAGKTLTLAKNPGYYARTGQTNVSTVTGGTLDFGGASRTFNVRDNSFVQAMGGAELTIESDISANGQNVIKAYDGTLRLNADSYDFQKLVINQGRVQVNSFAALGSGSESQIGNGNGDDPILEFLSDTDTDKGHNFNVGDTTAGGAAETEGAVVLNNGAGKVSFNWNWLNTLHASPTVARTVTLGGTNTLDNRYGGLRDLNGSGGIINLVKKDSGKWMADVTSTYTGTTEIQGGILQVNRRTGLYNGDTSKWTTANIVVSSNASLVAKSGGSTGFTYEDLQLLLALGDGSGGFASGSSVGIHTGPGDLTYSNVIANVNGGANGIGLRKMGGNFLILTENNTYTAPTVVEEGVLQIGNQGSTGDISSDVHIEEGAILRLRRNDIYTFDQTVSGEGRLEVYVDNTAGLTTLTEANTHSGGTALREGDLAITDSDALGTGEFLMRDDGINPKLYLNTDGLNITNNIRISDEGGAKQIIADQSVANHSVEISGDILIEETNLSNFELRAANPGDGVNLLTVSGDISGVGGVEKVAWGTVILSGDNTYSNGTLIADGMLQIGANGTSGSIIGDVSFVGGNGNDELRFARSNEYTFAGNISGDGKVSTVGNELDETTGDVGAGAGKFNSEILTLSGSNTYTVGTFVERETRIKAASNNALGAGDVNLRGQDSGLILADGVTITNKVVGIDDNRQHISVESGSATLDGNISLNNNSIYDFHLRPGSGNMLTVNGAIQDGAGSGNFIVSGAGTVVLNGDNTHTGLIRVDGSATTLEINGDNSAATGTMDVYGILQGSGIIGGNVNVYGQIKPGNSPGTLTFNEALLLGAASTTTIEIDSLASFDVLANDGDDTITFTDGATIAFVTDGYTASEGDSFQVLSNWNGYAGTLSNLTFTGTSLGSGLILDTSTLLTDGKITVAVSVVAGDLGVERNAGEGCKLHIDQLLAVCSDSEGLEIGVSSVDSVSAGGQPISVSNSWVYYTPSESYELGDSFNYSVTNSFGGSDSGQVTITIVGESEGDSMTLDIEPDAQGNVSITLRGIPGREAVVERTSDLVNGPWTPMETNTFNASGYFDFQDTNVPDPSFYRMYLNN